jgi:[ribosomal protein S5]-alanine N-acetyltransferase
LTFDGRDTITGVTSRECHYFNMLPTDPAFSAPTRTLETERLTIRITTEAEYVKAFKTLSDAELKLAFGISTEQELQTQKNKVLGGLSTYRTTVVFFHLLERNLNKVIGSFAFHNWYPIHNRSEIGYAMVAEEFYNQGYMKEAFSPIISFGFEVMKLNRMEAFINPENLASKKLVERAGFSQEGHLYERYNYEGILSDAIVYALLRKNYR